MTFWHTVFAVVVGSAIYDFIHMVLFGNREGDDHDDDCPA